MKKGRRKNCFVSLAETDLSVDDKRERKSKMSQMAAIMLTSNLVLFCR